MNPNSSTEQYQKKIKKVPCSQCGSMILEATANRNGGRCMRCKPQANPKGCFILLIVFVGIVAIVGALLPDDNQKSTAPNNSTPPMVQNVPWDNSVVPVKRYIKNNLKDPSSLEFIHWGDVVKTAEGTYVVNVKYRAKNSFGGYAISDQIYTMSANGTILNVNDY